MTQLPSIARHINTGSADDLVAPIPVTGFLRQWQVLAYIPISKSTLWRRIQAKTFPQPIKLSARVTVWRAEQIRDWIMAQSAGGVASASAPSAPSSSMRRAAAKAM
ncbi:AlpA family phage regulatory protein [Comamonadaceae bacterium G21597-S1]|nr:AlpA family phage regulatory protein [Comamonadaceae bacterium G21597-S1]